MTKRTPPPRFVLTLQALPGVDAIEALRWVLKRLLRQHGFRCLSLHEQPNKGRRSSARWRTGSLLCGGEFHSARNGTVTERSPVMSSDLRKYVSGRFDTLAEVFDQHPAPREQIAIVKDGSYGEPVLVFESGRQAGLNKASLGILMRELGDDPDTWIGQWVELGAGETKDHHGNMIDALIVRPVDAAPLPKPSTQAPQGGGEIDDEISFAPCR
jgi:hypothetical protein